MTPALNKMAVWLATMMVAGLMLLVSSAAQAHVAHGAETDAALPAFAAFVTQGLDDERSAGAAEATPPDVKVPTTDGGTRTDGERSNVDISCCGNAVSSCSSAILVQATPGLRLPPTTMADVPLGSSSMTGMTVDGLLRPPRAAV